VRRLRAALLPLLALALLAAFALACGEDSDFLLDDEGPDATDTPAFFQRSPEASPEGSPEPSPPAANATPVTPFEVSADGSVNLRDAPATDGNVEGNLASGDKATVIAKISGEKVTGNNDIWYQLEDGNFVYSGAVQEVAE
jgi:hypothetical protein